MSEEKKSSSSSDSPRGSSPTSFNSKNEYSGPSVYRHKNCERVCDQSVRPLRHYCNAQQKDRFMKKEEKPIENKKSRYPEFTEKDEEESFVKLVEKMKIGQPEREELAKAMGFSTSSSQK